MSNVDNDIWTTHLTAPMDAQRINYYIWAEANSGKSLTRPLPAPDGYWTFNIVSMATQDWANQNIQGPFPHPAKEKVHFDLKNISGKLKVSIHSMVGQTLSENQLENANGRITLNLNPAWKGVYLVSFEGDFGKVTKKLVVK